MPLQETSGNLTTDAYGGGVAAIPNYIEDVFSTYLYTGNGGSQTINNGIDLSTKGGLVWLKARNQAYDNTLIDTVRGNTNNLTSNSTSAQYSVSPGYITFGSSGFTLPNSGNIVNDTGLTMASWTFRKQPKFFDVVTYTGTGSAQTISHSLGSTPGFLLIKKTSSTGNWICFARVGTSSGKFTYAYFNTDSGLNLTAAASASGVGAENLGYITSTAFKPQDLSGSGDGGVNDINASGATYVAYLFAHNAGGFGLTGTDNVISCGSYTGTGVNPGPAINLGFEPQWVLVKNTTTAFNWLVYDTMRGMPNSSVNTGATRFLVPNLSNAESGGGTISPTATGFQLNTTYQGANASGDTYIYIAIRKGPMKVPTDATKVFIPVAQTDHGTVTTNFPVDLTINGDRSSWGADWFDRLRGGSNNYYSVLQSFNTSAEGSGTGTGSMGFDNNTGFVDYWNGNGLPAIYWNFKRAPSFFDEVCYTGTGATNTQTHNLGVVPELIILKNRTSANNWVVPADMTASTVRNLNLNTTNGSTAGSYAAKDVLTGQPTSTSFTLYFDSSMNSAGDNFVAYLFATCAGVSKVGSYTGNGTTQTINCGFTGGARFVLIKRTDASGDWYVYDTARGMTTLTDPYLFLNSTAAESATLGSVTTVTTGFAVNASILAAINTNGASYIFLAIS